MNRDSDILLRIRDSIANSAPKATVILYGSFARGENKKDSDLDLLILLERENISREDEIKIRYPLYEIEFDTGQIISPIVLSKSSWETKHRISPFYKNVIKEGIVL
jgi:predicted nucleotidyltransferase